VGHIIGVACRCGGAEGMVGGGGGVGVL